MTSHLSADRALALTTELAASSDALFTLTGAWATTADDPHAVIMMATLSRHLGEHTVWWRQLRPESVLLLEGSEPAAAVIGLADAPGADAPAADQVAWLTDRAVPQLRAAVDELAGSAGPEAAPFRRVARWVAIDLDAAFGGR